MSQMLETNSRDPAPSLKFMFEGLIIGFLSYLTAASPWLISMYVPQGSVTRHTARSIC